MDDTRPVRPLIDKIPICLFKEDPITDTYKLSDMVITKAEYANAEKINEILDLIKNMYEDIEVIKMKVKK